MGKYYCFMIEGYQSLSGNVYFSVVLQVTWDEHWNIDEEKGSLPLQAGDEFTKCTRCMEQTLQSVSPKSERSASASWCDELFPVHESEGKHVLDLDSAGVDKFGMTNYACHLIAFVMTKDGRKYYVPRRAKTKQSFPDMLDNSVGGSLSSGEKPIICIVRECKEESLLPTDYASTNIPTCGGLYSKLRRRKMTRQDASTRFSTCTRWRSLNVLSRCQMTGRL